MNSTRVFTRFAQATAAVIIVVAEVLIFSYGNLHLVF